MTSDVFNTTLGDLSFGGKGYYGIGASEDRHNHALCDGEATKCEAGT